MSARPTPARLILLMAALGLLAACSEPADDAVAAGDDIAAADAPSERGQEPFDVVDGDLDPADEVTEGDGWELLDTSPRSFNQVGASVADDESQLDRAWSSHRMEGEPPSVDLGERIAVIVTIPSDCDFVLRDVGFEDVTADDIGWETGEVRLTAQTPESCGDPDPDAAGRTLALALDRDRVDVDRIFISIGDGVPLGEGQTS